MKNMLCLLLLLLGVASAQGEQSPWTWRQMMRSIDELQSLQSGVAPHQSIVAGVVTQSVSTVSVPALSAPTSVAPTTSSKTFSLKSGETMSGRFGKQAQAICAYNQVANCNIVQAGKSYRLPQGTVPQAIKMPATALSARLAASTQALGNMFFWERVGGAPLRECGKQDVAMVKEKAWNVLIKQGLLTEAERDELRVLTRGMTEPKIGHADNGTVQLTRGMRLESVTFCKNGQPVVRTNVKTAWDFGTAVFAQEFTLKSGKRVLWVRNCLNWSTRSPLPPPVVAEPPVVVPPEAAPTPPLVTPPPPPPVTVLTPRPPEVQMACDEYDARASAGVELSQGAGTRTVSLYGDAEFGTCPFKWEDKAGVFNEALIAGRVHAADDTWRGWDGKTVTAMAGFGLRRSFPDGSMDLYRLMAGMRTNDGSQGLYLHDARWKVLGLYGTHYRIEDDGTDETHYRWGLNVPFGQTSGSASYNGSPLSLPRYNGSIEVGVRRYVDPQGEDIRRFWELNATVVSPDYAGISPRVGVCNGDDTLCGLVGVNIDVQNGGVAAMVGVQVNTPGVIRYNRDGRIMKDVVKAAEVNGITFSFAPATKRK